MALRTAQPLQAPSFPSRLTPARSSVLEHVAWAILIVILASVLRLPAPDLTPFGHDEALEAERARPIWYGARPVESEVTSWWIPDPAGLLYFFALAEAFPRPAIARVELVAAANVLAVLVCYLLGRRFFGPAVGLAAGVLYATNPWAVTFGRQPWVITQPLLTAAMLFAAMMVVVRSERRWIVPFFLALAAQSQTHLLAVLYAPSVVLTLVVFARRWLSRELALGCAAAALIVAPFALHLWDIRQDVLEALERGDRGLTLAPNESALRLTAWLVSGYQLEAKLGLPSPALESLRWPLAGVAVAATSLLLAGVAISVLACARRRPGWEAHALLLIWLLGPLLLMLWQGSAVYIHYVLVLLPTVFLLMALPLARLARGSIGHQLAVGVAAIICAVQLAALGAFYLALEWSLAAPATATTPSEWQAALNRAELAAKQAGIGEVHGLPLRYWQSVADRAKAVAATAQLGPDVIVITGIPDDANRHLDERRKALDYLLGPQLAPRFPLEGLTVLPSVRDTLFLTIPEQDLPRAASREANRLADVPLPGTNGATRLWSVPARSLDEIAPRRALANHLFETGVRLLALEAPARAQPGQSLAVASYWLVERDLPAADEDDQPFVELLDATGETLAYQAVGGLPSQKWRPGDVLVQRSTLVVPPALPPGEYRLAAGLTSRRGDGRAHLLDQHNSRAGTSAQAATVLVRADR